MDEVMNRLEAYFARLEKQGAKVPSSWERKKPHFRAISAAAGVNFRFLLEQRYKNRIALAVEEIGLDPESKLQLSRRKEQGATLLTAYVQALKNRGLKLPEDPRKRGKVFYSQVEAEAGVSCGLLKNVPINENGEHDSALLRIIDDAVLTVGTELRILRTPAEPTDSRVTYEQLLERGTVERKRELEGRSNARQQLYNTRWALNFFRKSLDLAEEAPAGHELFDEFTAHLQKVLEKVSDADTRKKVQTEARWWQCYYQKFLKAQPIPEDIHGAIAYLINASGLSLYLLSKLIGMSLTILTRWYEGQTTPRMLSRHALARMEALFKLPAGTLLCKIPNRNRRWHFRSSELPEFLRENRALAKKVIGHLPEDFCSLPCDKQHEIVNDISKNIAGHDDEYARRMAELKGLAYRLKQFPCRLGEELEEFFSFKTMERPPLGMRRNYKWRPTTKKKRESELQGFFGALRLSREAEEPCLRGPGIPVEHLTTAFIVCPLVVDWYLRFRGEIRTQYTKYQIDSLQMFMEMLRPDFGWLRQKPQLASRLVPVSFGNTELVSPDFIARAREDWSGVCDETIERYEALTAEIEPLVTVFRDPFSRIEGIVEMDDPMQAIIMLVEGMRRDWPNVKTAPVLHHLAVRDTATVLLIGLTSFRRHTLSQLDYTGDESGHLFMSGGKYVLHVPRHLFKEETSSYFGPKHAQIDYYMEVPDVHGWSEVLTKYLTESRTWLLEHYYPECDEHPLLVTSGRGKSVRLSDNRITTIYYRATETYLVENKWRSTGIEKVGRHGPHSARHIRGTAIVKKTGSFLLAGDANQTTEKTARKHYTRFSPKDKNRRVNDALF